MFLYSVMFCILLPWSKNVSLGNKNKAKNHLFVWFHISVNRFGRLKMFLMLLSKGKQLSCNTIGEALQIT